MQDHTFKLKRTYRFKQRRKITAANYEAAIIRNLSPKMPSPAQSFIEDIVGAKAVIDGNATRVSGVKLLARGSCRSS